MEEEQDIYMNFPKIQTLDNQHNNTLWEMMLHGIISNKGNKLMYGAVRQKLVIGHKQITYAQWMDALNETLEKQPEILKYYNIKGKFKIIDDRGPIYLTFEKQ